jgi:hypothetical protein
VKAMAFSKIMKKEKKNKVPHSTIISVLWALCLLCLWHLMSAIISTLQLLCLLYLWHPISSICLSSVSSMSSLPMASYVSYNISPVSSMSSLPMATYVSYIYQSCELYVFFAYGILCDNVSYNISDAIC